MTTLQARRIARAYDLPVVRFANYRNDRSQHNSHVLAYKQWLHDRHEGHRMARRLAALLHRVRWLLMPPRTRTRDTLYSWVGFYDSCCTFEFSVGVGHRPSYFKRNVK